MIRLEIVNEFKKDFEKVGEKLEKELPERYNKERYMKNRLEELNAILDIFEEKNIDFKIEIKEGWGKIFVFEIRGNKVFTNTYSKKKKKLDIYYYSDEYSCKPCRLKF